MKALLVIFSAVIALVLSSPPPPPNPMADVPECKKLLDKGDAAYNLQNCNAEVNTCFKEAHAMAPKCLAKGIKYFKENHPTKFECFHKPEIENLKKAWFAASCNQHLAVVHCMAGDEPTEDFEKTTTITDQQLEAAKQAKKAWMEKGTAEYPELGACWQEMMDKMKECHTKATSECDNFGVCIASSEPAADASEKIKTWHEIGHVLEKIKYAKVQDFITGGEACW